MELGHYGKPSLVVGLNVVLRNLAYIHIDSQKTGNYGVFACEDKP
jgi:hypothetical protein